MIICSWNVAEEGRSTSFGKSEMMEKYFQMVKKPIGDDQTGVWCGN
jgi:hypothetical protein